MRLVPGFHGHNRPWRHLFSMSEGCAENQGSHSTSSERYMMRKPAKEEQEGAD